MNLSHHAEARARQRGIPPVAIDLVLDYGSIEFHRGREVFRLDKKGLRKARQYLGKMNDGYSSVLKDIYVVVDGETVVTVARTNGHFRRDRG